MGFDSDWWLVDPERSSSQRVALNDWLDEHCREGSSTSTHLQLPERNDIGFFMGFCDWRSQSPACKGFSDDPAEVLRRAGLYARPGLIKLPLWNGMTVDPVWAAARRPDANLGHMRRVLPSLGIRASLTSAQAESIYISGAVKRLGLSMLARLAAWELQREVALGAATFDKYLDRSSTDAFLELLGHGIEVPGSVLVCITHI